MEFVLRQSLETAQASLPGLPPENKHKMTNKPTAERLLQAFAGLSLTIIQNAAGEAILRRLTPLSGLQHDILQWLVELSRNNPSLYTVNGRPLYVHLNGLAIVLLK